MNSRPTEGVGRMKSEAQQGKREVRVSLRHYSTSNNRACW